MAYPTKTSRENILSVALEQVESAGIEKLGLRSLAAALGLTPNALYRYFDSFEALQAALADESRLRLLRALKKAAAAQTPADALRKMARAYMKFAREEPNLFALTLRGPVVGDDADDDAGDDASEPSHLQSWAFFLAQVSQLYSPERAPEAGMSLWAFLHGLAVLEAAGVLQDNRKPASSFEFGLEMWIKAADL